MDDLSVSEVWRLVDAANAPRWQGGASGSDVVSDARRAERRLDDLFRTGHTLATYGTLAPGRPNHHVVAPLGGEWTEGLIEGDLLPVGWGADLGYPGFCPRVGGDAVAVWVLEAPLLAGAWLDLDRFEGEGYRRILVPVFAKEIGSGQAGERQRQALQMIFGGQAGSWPAAFAEVVGEIRGIEFVPIEFELADDLAYWRAEIPGMVEASAEALTGPTTPEGQRVQLHHPPGSEVGPSGTVATWGRATADRAEGFGFKWEWDGKSSKHIPFEWSGP